MPKERTYLFRDGPLAGRATTVAGDPPSFIAVSLARSGDHVLHLDCPRPPRALAAYRLSDGEYQVQGMSTPVAVAVAVGEGSGMAPQWRVAAQKRYDSQRDSRKPSSTTVIVGP